MHASGWIDLIHTIPADLHGSLTFLMQNRSEVNTQNVVRLEEQFIVCRGRFAGSTENGIIFFLPYDQIAAIVVNKPTKAEAVDAWFPNPPCYSLEVEVASTVVPEAMEPEAEPAAPAPAAAPGLAPAAGPVAPKPAVAAPPKPVVPTVPAKPAPGPQPAMTAMTMANLAMPAKAAMIERLRKRQPPGGPAAPEQK